MAKRKVSRATGDHTVSLKLSPEEYQLISYAASKSNARGVNAWMRGRLVEAAKAKLNDRIVQDILRGRATVALLKESLKEGKRVT